MQPDFFIFCWFVSHTNVLLVSYRLILHYFRLFSLGVVHNLELPSLMKGTAILTL